MTTSFAERPPVVSGATGAMTPAWARLVGRVPESSNTTSYVLQFTDPQLARRFSFLPGQFNMLYLFGVGEAAISISSDPSETETLVHTIRHVGSVTFAMNRLRVGQCVGLRGPFGSSWPLEHCRGRDILLVAGGIGIAPLRPVIYQLLNNRDQYGRVILLYGVRSRADMIFERDVQNWSARPDIQVLVTVDYPDKSWTGPVGVVTKLLRRVRVESQRTSVFVCGPRVMNRATAHAFLSHYVSPEHIFVSLERNMRCGIGQCGHCQYGPKFVCKDGPVFSYASVQTIFGKDEV